MADKPSQPSQDKGLSIFAKYLTVGVILCIAGGTLLGKTAPGFAQRPDGLAIYVGNAPMVSIPIAVCLFFMMCPIMVKTCQKTQGWFSGPASGRIVSPAQKAS